MKVLIADDDRVLSHLLASRLRAKGCQVVTAFNAGQAFVSIMRSAPDVVVLDILMPGATGIEVLKKLKTSTRTSHIPVIVLSGSMEPVAAAALVVELGAVEFIAKPVNPDNVHRAVVSAVESAQAAALHEKLARYRRMSAPGSSRTNAGTAKIHSGEKVRESTASRAEQKPSLLQARNLP